MDSLEKKRRNLKGEIVEETLTEVMRRLKKDENKKQEETINRAVESNDIEKQVNEYISNVRKKQSKTLDAEARRHVPAVCRRLFSNVRGLAGNLSDLTVAVSRYDILLCSETLVSDMCHVSELLVPGFRRPVLLCRGRMPRARGMAAYIRTRWIWSISPTQV